MSDATRQRMGLMVGWLTLFVVASDLFVVSPLLPAIAQHYAVAPATAALMVPSFALTYALAAPWLGALGDRVGRRRLIVFGLAAFAAGNALTGLLLPLAWLLAARALTGLAAAAITPSIYAIIGDVAPQDRRGTWLAIVGSGGLIALWAGAPLGTLLAQVSGWPSVFLLLASCSVPLAVLNRLAWPPARAATGQAPVHGGFAGTAAILSQVSVTAIWSVALYGFYIYLGTELRLQDHVSATGVAEALLLYGIGATVGSLYGGRLADRLGAWRTIRASLGALAGLLIAAGLAFRSEALLFVLLPLWALVGYAFFPAIQARLAQTFPARRGLALAFNNTALYAGISAGSLICGFVVSHAPFLALPGVCAAFALAAMLSSGRVGGSAGV